MANAGLLNPFGNGGRTDNSAYYNNLDKNMYLSASDMGKTITITNSNGYGVILPDARQLIKTVVINIANKSSKPISVFNNNGAILKVIPVNQVVLCWCTSKTSSSGVWSTQILGTSLFNSVGIGTPNSVWTTTLQNSSLGLIQFSSTAVLLSFINNTYLYVYYLTLVNDTTISNLFGGSKSLSGYPSIGSHSMCSNSSAAALIVISYMSQASYYSYISFVVTVDVANSTVSISSGSIVANTSLATGLSAYGNVYVTEVSTNKFAVSSSWYFNSGSYYTYAPIYYFTMSGSTVASSTMTWVQTDTNWNQIYNICAVDSNTVIVGYTANSTSTSVIKKFNVASGTPSETSSMLLTGSTSQFSVVPVSNTAIIVAATTKLWLVDTSAALTITTSITHGISVSFSSLTKLTDSTYMLVTLYSNKQYFTQVTLNGSTITLSNVSVTTADVGDSDFVRVAKLTNRSAIGLSYFSTDNKVYATLSIIS